MTRNAVMYAYPFAVDIVVALLLFVARHSLASRGMSEGAVGSILLCYGLGYCGSSLFMRKIVRPHLARGQMLVALAGLVMACVALANTEEVWLIQTLFCLVPFAVSLFINAFQSFMLGVSTRIARPLASTAGHYTFAWSLGYALGPFVSGASRSYLAWGQVYYLAAGIAAGVGLLVVLNTPTATGQAMEARPSVAPDSATGEPSLVRAAWVGLALGWIGWNVVSTYWPVQATQLGFSARVKGMVEFAFALAQSLGALALVYAGGWHHRPLMLPVLGMVGCVGLVVFGMAAGPWTFVAGALLFGLYTSSIFSYVVYHSMLEEDKAVGRVALNETVVGLSFLAGPVVASFLHQPGELFGPVYVRLAGLLAGGIAMQTTLAWWTSKNRATRRPPTP